MINNSQELLALAYIGNDAFPCRTKIKCPYKERSLSYAIGIQIPIPTEDPEAIFNECCYVHHVFADVNSNDDFKNDYSSFYHQRQLSNETCEFKLVHLDTSDEYDLNDPTFGTFFGFGYFSENINLKGYLVKWKNVLDEIGEGNFKIVKSVTIAGITTEFNSIVFTLNQFSALKADKTTRIDVVMNGRLEKTGIDFTGIGWKHSIRLPGFFGRRDPSIEEDNIVNRQFEKRQISMKQTNEYKFQTNLIPNCLTDEFFDFFLFANDIYFNDYNLNNHSYNFIKFGVKVAQNDGTKYGVKTRKAQLNFTFNDKFDNNIKRNFK